LCLIHILQRRRITLFLCLLLFLNRMVAAKAEGKSRTGHGILCAVLPGNRPRPRRFETIDPSHIDTQEGAPHYEAELRLLLTDDGVKRFQRFNKSHDGQSFEVRVNGEVLLTGIGANGQGGAVRDLSWFVASMEEAGQFAAVRNFYFLLSIFCFSALRPLPAPLSFFRPCGVFTHPAVNLPNLLTSSINPGFPHGSVT